MGFAACQVCSALLIATFTLLLAARDSVETFKAEPAALQQQQQQQSNSHFINDSKA